MTRAKQPACARTPSPRVHTAHVTRSPERKRVVAQGATTGFTGDQKWKAEHVRKLCDSRGDAKMVSGASAPIPLARTVHLRQSDQMPDSAQTP